jgi:hypothetical protein
MITDQIKNDERQRRCLKPTIKERAELILKSGQVLTMAEAEAKARLQALSERRQTLEKKHKAILAEIKKVESSKERKADTRRKIMIGGWMLAEAGKNFVLRFLLEREALPYLFQKEPELFRDFSLPKIPKCAAKNDDRGKLAGDVSESGQARKCEEE